MDSFFNLFLGKIKNDPLAGNSLYFLVWVFCGPSRVVLATFLPLNFPLRRAPLIDDCWLIFFFTFFGLLSYAPTFLISKTKFGMHSSSVLKHRSNLGFLTFAAALFSAFTSMECLDSLRDPWCREALDFSWAFRDALIGLIFLNLVWLFLAEKELL